MFHNLVNSFDIDKNDTSRSGTLILNLSLTLLPLSYYVLWWKYLSLLDELFNNRKKLRAIF